MSGSKAVAAVYTVPDDADKYFATFATDFFIYNREKTLKM